MRRESESLRMGLPRAHGVDHLLIALPYLRAGAIKAMALNRLSLEDAVVFLKKHQFAPGLGQATGEDDAACPLLAPKGIAQAAPQRS